MLVLDKKTMCEVPFDCDDFNHLKDTIKKIKSSDFETHSFVIIYTKELDRLFYETYNKKFYTINDDLTFIGLNSLKNGERRTLPKPRKVNNEKTFSNTIHRIYMDLKNDYRSISATIRDNSAIGCIIQIELSEDINIKGNIQIRFNKLKWEYQIISIVSMYDFDEVYKNVKHAFEYRTASTRKYRANKK